MVAVVVESCVRIITRLTINVLAMLCKCCFYFSDHLQWCQNAMFFSVIPKLFILHAKIQREMVLASPIVRNEETKALNNFSYNKFGTNFINAKI